MYSITMACIDKKLKIKKRTSACKQIERCKRLKF